MRDNYLAFLSSGKLKKSKISVLCLIWLKTTMRIMMWQQGNNEWPNAKFFIKVFFQAMPLEHRNTFKLQYDTKKLVTVNNVGGSQRPRTRSQLRAR